MDNNVYLIRNQYSWVADNINIPDFKTMAGENEIMMLYPPNTFKPVIRLLEKGKTGAFKFKILKEIKIVYLHHYVLQRKLIAWKLKKDDSNSVLVGRIRTMFNLHHSMDKKSGVIIRVDSINTKDYKNIFLSNIDRVWVAGS